MEEASLAGGGARVKFALEERGEAVSAAEADGLARASGHDVRVFSLLMSALEECGAAPVLPDGKVGGNGALLLEGGALLVTRSGKPQGLEGGPGDMVVVRAFDRDAWRVAHAPCGAGAVEGARPTSDTPLLWSALVDGPARHGWRGRGPRVALHGHALHREEDARALGLPISPEETLFSTPEDLAALEALFSRSPYPQTRLFLRRGHGFFLLADTLDEAADAVLGVVLPHADGRGPWASRDDQLADAAARGRTATRELLLLRRGGGV